MKRQLSRLYRQHGIRYFAMPLLVVLALAAAADQVLPSYLERRVERVELANTSERNISILALGERYKKKYDALASNFENLSKQVIFEPATAQAGQQLQDSVRQILQSLYFDEIEILGLTDKKLDGATILTTGVRFTGVPQQLPRLEAALASSPYALTVDSMEIRAVDDIKRGGKQLLIIAQISALQMMPPNLPEVAEVKR